MRMMEVRRTRISPWKAPELLTQGEMDYQVVVVDDQFGHFGRGYARRPHERYGRFPVVIRRRGDLAESLAVRTVYAVTVCPLRRWPSAPEGGAKHSPVPRTAPPCYRRDDAMDSDSRTRAAIEEHWRASERGETEAEHAIYAEDAILDYPQSGERFRSRATIAAQRGGHPADRHFTVIRISGSGNLWVSECVITYDGVPTLLSEHHGIRPTSMWRTRHSTSRTPSVRLPGGQRSRGADAGPGHRQGLTPVRPSRRPGLWLPARTG